MSYGLPPELSRLGDELSSAAERTRDRRRHRAERRRRVAATVLAGALIFAALTPAALEPAHRDVVQVASVRGCDPPRSDKFPHTGCGAPMVLHRPYAVQ
jgi:hypothetical protein